MSLNIFADFDKRDLYSNQALSQTQAFLLKKDV